MRVRTRTGRALANTCAHLQVQNAHGRTGRHAREQVRAYKRAVRASRAQARDDTRTWTHARPGHAQP
eukprot:4791895-Pleurochrysis_carterae.AAC.1